MLIHTQIVEFQGSEAPVLAYLGHPKREGSFPGVLVLQEWWSIDSHIQQVTERLAQEGFVALAPDLYRGQLVIEMEKNQKQEPQLNRQNALQDLHKAVNYLISSRLVEPHPIGIIGFGKGGAIGLNLAALEPRVSALVGFYVAHNTDDPGTPEALQESQSPYLAFYGGKDERVPLNHAQWLKEQLTQAQKKHKIVVYPEATHGFVEEANQSYQADIAQDAWYKTLDWLRQHLA